MKKIGFVLSLSFWLLFSSSVSAGSDNVFAELGQTYKEIFTLEIPRIVKETADNIQAGAEYLAAQAGFLERTGSFFKSIGSGIKELILGSEEEPVKPKPAGPQKPPPIPSRPTFPSSPPPPAVSQSQLTELRKEIENLKSSGLRVERIIEKPTIIEKTIERIVSGISGQDLEAKLNQLNEKIISRSDANFQAIALSQRINTLSNVSLSNPTITGSGSLTGSSLSISGAGSIDTLSLNGPAYFSQISAPSVTTDRLYNMSGDLYWAGNLVGSASVGNWTLSGSNVYRSNGNVGIGTTSPYANLSVEGSSALGNSALAGYFTATSTTATSTFAGGVTIATSSPWSNGGQVPKLAVQGYITSNSLRIGGADVLNTIYQEVGDLSISVSSGNNSKIYIGNTDKSGGINIINSGNIGIGTTTPYARLSVEGSSALGNSALAGYFTATSTTATSTFAGGLAVETSGLVYDYSTNNVGIGTVGPVQKLHIQNTRTTAYDAGDFITWADTIIKNPTATNNAATGIGFVVVDGVVTNQAAGIAAIRTAGIDTQTDLAFITRPNSSASAERLRITSAGFVGIGTTSPSTKLSVGGAAGDTTGHGYFTGGLGVGILNTTANTFRVGQCVTGDTKLRRRRRRKIKSKEADSDSDYIYDEVAIKDIQAGDEIASLDEKTGKIVWSKVKRLAYMGKKQTFKLTTEDGRQIRTTANHPYLTKQGWTKVSDLRPGMPIAAPRARGKRVYSFIDLSNVYHGAREGGWEMDYGALYRYLTTRYGASKVFIFGGASDKPERIRQYEDFSHIGYEVLLVPTRKRDDGSGKADVDSRMTFEMMRLKNEYDRAVVITGDGDFYWVLEYLKATKERVWLLGMNKRTARDLKGLFGDDFADLARLRPMLSLKTQKAEPVRVSAFAAADAFDGSVAGINTSYANPTEKSSPESSATVDNSMAWVKTRSIEPVAEEDVYDVEIENTHNFIGNDIVAHNTAFMVDSSGNIGIGTTTPYARLSVEGSSALGNSALAGYFTATSTTATSTFSTGGLTVGTSQFVVQQTSGNVGIGTANPLQQLHIGGIGNTAQMALSGDPFSNQDGLRITYNPTAGIRATSIDTRGLSLRLRGDSTSSGQTEIMYLDLATGSVGIGTTSPNWLLQTAGTRPFFALSDTNASVNLKHWTLSSQGGNLYIATSSDALATSTIPALMINSNGNVGIGTSSPSSLLTVGSSGAGFQVDSSGLITTSSVGTAALRTATGNTSGTVNTNITLNDYSFFPSITTSDTSGWAVGTQISTADPGNTTARFRLASGLGTWIARWRYVTASDRPIIWLIVEKNGDISAVWEAEDPVGQYNWPENPNPFEGTELQDGQYFLSPQPLTIELLKHLYDKFPLEIQNKALHDLADYLISRGWLNNFENLNNFSLINERYQPVGQEWALRFLAKANNIDPATAIRLFLQVYNNELAITENPYQNLIDYKEEIKKEMMTSGEINNLARQSDIAEFYAAAEETISAGDLVSLDSQNGLLIKANKPYDKNLMGVVSSMPSSVIGNKMNKNDVMLALTGRVPVKVSLENGPISIGDRITSSSVPGVGMKATSSGQTIGLALEKFDGILENGIYSAQGKIMVFINLGYHKIDEPVSNGQLLNDNNNQMFIVDQVTGRIKTSYGLDLNGQEIINVSRILSASGNWSLDENGKLIVSEIEVKKKIIMYDEITNEKYCLLIRGGEWIKEKCEAPPPSIPSAEPQESASSTPPESTPPAAENQQ